MALRKGVGAAKPVETPTPPPKPVAKIIRPLSMESGANCGNCAFFDQAGAGSRSIRGICRRRPVSSAMGTFPVVHLVDWCGEYELR